jgi:hypothetical protein
MKLSELPEQSSAHALMANLRFCNPSVTRLDGFVKLSLDLKWVCFLLRMDETMGCGSLRGPGRMCGSGSMIRSVTLLRLALLMPAFALPADAQQVDFSALGRYGDACTKLKASILTDAGQELGKDDHIVDWISDCNGNIPACQDERDAIAKVKKASSLDCLGRPQSHEAASAAYSLYLERIGELPRCIAQRC